MTRCNIWLVRDKVTSRPDFEQYVPYLSDQMSLTKWRDFMHD